MGHTVQLSEPITFEREDCCNCGVTFFVPSDLQARRKKDAKFFYCPNGHGQHYSVGEADRLRAQLAEAEKAKQRALKEKEWAQESARQDRESRLAAERRLTAAKGQQTRLRNRIKNGVCPCCTRHFDNLQRHIATKHPDFKPEADSQG